MRLALRAHDGRARPTPFLLEVMGRLGPDAFTLVAWAEQATATEYASLAPVALSYAEVGDPFAESRLIGDAVAGACIWPVAKDAHQGGKCRYAD